MPLGQRQLLPGTGSRVPGTATSPATRGCDAAEPLTAWAFASGEVAAALAPSPAVLEPVPDAPPALAGKAVAAADALPSARAADQGRQGLKSNVSLLLARVC